MRIIQWIKEKNDNWPLHVISVLIASASSEGSGESAHMRRLARTFAACLHKVDMQMKAQTKF